MGLKGDITGVESVSLFPTCHSHPSLPISPGLRIRPETAGFIQDPERSLLGELEFIMGWGLGGGQQGGLGDRTEDSLLVSTLQLLLPEASSRRLQPDRKAEGKPGIRAGDQGWLWLQMLVILRG